MTPTRRDVDAASMSCHCDNNAAVERRRQVVHAVAVVDELPHETHDQLVAALETAREVVHFEGYADVVPIANVETQAPLVLGSRQQKRAHQARDSGDAAMLVARIGSMKEIRHHRVVLFPLCIERRPPIS